MTPADTATLLSAIATAAERTGERQRERAAADRASGWGYSDYFHTNRRLCEDLADSLREVAAELKGEE